MTDLSLVSMLKTRMHWQQTRQKVLAENVANANTPGYAPRDLKDMTSGFGQSLAAVQTSPLHLAMASDNSPGSTAAGRFETQPSGNAVSLEDEMMKISGNQGDYQLAASLYQKSLAMLRTAVGAKA